MALVIVGAYDWSYIVWSTNEHEPYDIKMWTVSPNDDEKN